MPTTTADDGTELYYEVEGSGEAITFVGEAGLGAWQWGSQYAAMTGPYQTVVWDFRGTGRSGSPSGDLNVDRLSQDLESVLAAADCKNCHLVGAGLGGMVCLRYARMFDRAETLTLFNTAPSGETVDLDALETLCLPGTDREDIESSLSVALSPEFRDANPEVLDRIVGWRGEENADAGAFAKQAAAIEGFEADPLYELTVPTLVCQAQDDPVVDSTVGEELSADLPRGTFVPVEGRHLCFFEHARPVTDRMLGFIEDESD
ncbi:alpha/beta fold hydrolase [Halovenus salina]|uniref:alpha/beta fold hydrolase n=1 Tax=Halovenus salina TaxID=1510225 RepID=UPI002260F7DD|nr:alpha/beta hydrolase [Halovenus salina]